MDLHKRLPAMSLEHHKPLKLCQRSERITSSPSLLSWPSSLSLPSWLSSQVPPPQRPSSSTSLLSLLSLLSLPSSPSWPSLPSSPSWEPFWEVRTVESGSEEFWRGLGHENKRHVTSVEMWHLRCALNDFVSDVWQFLLAMEKIYKVWFQHAPSLVFPRREPKSSHSDSVTQLSVHSSRQMSVVFALVCYQQIRWKPRTRMYSRSWTTSENLCDRKTNLFFHASCAHIVSAKAPDQQFTKRQLTHKDTRGKHRLKTVHISPVTNLQCGVESVECGVWSVKQGLWTVKCPVGSVECRVCKV